MGLMNSYEPAPIVNNERPCWDDVIEYYSKTCPGHQYKDDIINLMYERDMFGRSKYGKPLQAFDGRDTFKEILQEIADGITYSQKGINEGKDYYGNLTILRNMLITALETAYIMKKSEDFCEHGFDLTIENCVVEDCCR